MDDDKKKVVMIIIVMACIGLAAGITFWASRGGGRQSGKNKLAFMCMNPKCGETWEMTIKEFQKKLGDTGSRATPMGPMLYDCPDCGKKSAIIANKCPKCGEIFVPDPRKAMKDYPDRCPKCGYSDIEDHLKEREKK